MFLIHLNDFSMSYFSSTVAVIDTLYATLTRAAAISRFNGLVDQQKTDQQLF